MLGVIVLVFLWFAIAPERLHPSAREPSANQIAAVMWRTVLVRERFEHFYPAGQLATVSDGSGGEFIAEVGTVLPSTDGDGQLVFFWHNRRFVGWDSPLDNMDVLDIHALHDGTFRVTYANYASNDPACCPSLIPISVVYRWNGHRFVAEGPLPSVRPIPNLVRLIH